ncbi:MAG: hypothetical protein ACI8XM_001790 [Haloarculaceae archaeon]
MTVTTDLLLPVASTLWLLALAAHGLSDDDPGV